MVYIVHAHSGDQILGGGQANGCMFKFFILLFNIKFLLSFSVVFIINQS